ncbi:MAG: hypothetical protein QNK35_05125, partial [Bacteroides sp.]|nr:hypothetical protein [Bacteroides sp.]
NSWHLSLWVFKISLYSGFPARLYISPGSSFRLYSSSYIGFSPSMDRPGRYWSRSFSLLKNQVYLNSFPPTHSSRGYP